MKDRLTDLQQSLKGWSPRGGEQSFKWYKRYLQSDYMLLPYPGGQVNQPIWWWDDVEIMEVIGEKHWLPTEIKRVEKQLRTNLKNLQRKR